jgi:hypothetical protein
LHFTNQNTTTISFTIYHCIAYYFFRNLSNIIKTHFLEDRFLRETHETKIKSQHGASRGRKQRRGYEGRIF